MDLDTRIVQAASACFAKKGFQGASVKEIAKLARCNEVTIFRKYQTKEDLISSVLSKKLFQSVPVEQIEGCYHLSPREFLCRVAEMVYHTRFSEPEIPRLMMYTVLEAADGASRINQYLAPYFDAIDRYYKKKVEEGILRSVEPDLAVNRFISYMIHGHFFYQQLLGGPQVEKKDIIACAVDVLMNGIMVGRDGS